MAKITFSVCLIFAIEFLALASSHDSTSCTLPKLVCYENIDYTATTIQSGIKSDLCDYIIFANAELEPTGLLVQFVDAWLKFKLLYSDRVNAYHAIGTKVLIALGSWSDSNSDKYARMMGDSASRDTFVEQSIQYVRDHNFDGMQVEYTNPFCRQLNCTSGLANERSNYTQLIKEMSVAYKEAGLILSILVDGRQPDIIQKSFSIGEVSSYVDFITVFTEQRVETGPLNTVQLSPLYSQGRSLSVENTFNYLIASGAPASKLALKIATYGIQFNLANPANNGVGVAATGTATWSTQVCTLTTNNGWTVVNGYTAGSYAYQNTTWIAFNDKSLDIRKAVYAERLGLFAIVMSDPFTSDDPINACGGGQYPILHEIHSVLQTCPPQKPADPCDSDPCTISTQPSCCGCSSQF